VIFGNIRGAFLATWDAQLLGVPENSYLEQTLEQRALHLHSRCSASRQKPQGRQLIVDGLVGHTLA
jgi:hypothetical protein